MKKTIITVMSLLFLLGCKNILEEKPVEKVPGETDTRYSWSDAIREARELSDSEKEVGIEVCNAIKSKRELFSTYQNKQEFLSFKLRSRSCGQRSWGNYINFRGHINGTRSGTMSYQRSSGRSFMLEDLLTDRSRRLLGVCESLLQGTSTPNIIRSGNKKILTTFINLNGKKVVKFVEFKTINSTYFPYMQEEYFIYTSADTTINDLIGVAYQRTQVWKCMNGSSKFYEQKVLP